MKNLLSSYPLFMQQSRSVRPFHRLPQVNSQSEYSNLSIPHPVSNLFMQQSLAGGVQSTP